MRVSVIIPTFNRADFLRGTLHTLAAQTFSSKDFEVLVVDDGSTDATREVCSESYSFELRYVYQSNQGDAEARNTGVECSQAEILVFLDDDMQLHPEYLSEIVPHHLPGRERIVIGRSILWVEEFAPPWRDPLAADSRSAVENPCAANFTDVCSNNMSLLRKTYFAVGRMSALNFRGSSLWCDVEFAYRAQQRGVEFLRNSRAVCWHVDHVGKTFEAQKKRMRESGFRAGPLFQKHPALANHLPMFEDKLPIDWRNDSLRLLVRKATRRVASARLMLQILERTHQLARAANAHEATQAISRWILGGYLFSGFRDGLRSLKNE